MDKREVKQEARNSLKKYQNAIIREFLQQIDITQFFLKNLLKKGFNQAELVCIEEEAYRFSKEQLKRYEMVSKSKVQEYIDVLQRVKEEKTQGMQIRTFESFYDESIATFDFVMHHFLPIYKLCKEYHKTEAAIRVIM